jgi:serine protease Do
MSFALTRDFSPARRRLAGAAAALALVFAIPTADARSAPDSFAPLVKQVMPAVVNVAVVRDLRSAETGEPQASPFPPGSPWDEFMRRFAPPRRTPGDGKATSLGSGFVIDPAGYIVTNHHVVGDAREISVGFSDGRQFAARLIGRDDKTDLALLKVDADRPLPFVRWGDSDKAEIGDWVLAVGNPFGLGGTVTAGIISARGRDIQAGPYDDFLQLDAPINQGNSGGPSFNMDGQVIGVNTAIFSPSGGSVGIGFAIPSALARPVIEQLKAEGRMSRGWIGISIQTLTPEIAFGLGLRTDIAGALVAQVEPGGPAAQSGLRQGDVITAVDARAMSQLRDLPRAIAAYKPGSKARLTVMRRSQELSLEVSIGAQPGPRSAAATVESPSHGTICDQLGLAVAPLTPELRRRLDLAASTRGVLVAEVRDGSVADDAGLVNGDLIVEIGGTSVSSSADLERAVSAARAAGRSSVVLLVARRGAEQFVALKLPRAAS